MKIENPVFVARKFENEQSPRCTKIHFHVAGAHPWVFSRFRAPRARHGVSVCVEFWLNIVQVFHRFFFGRFHLKFEQRRWPVEVQGVWLRCISNLQARCSDGEHGHANDHQTDE